MTVAIFLNGEYLEGGIYGAHYEDRWGINPETGDIHAFVRGQNQGRMDYLITEATVNNSDVYFYTRKNKRSPLIFRGIGKVAVERLRVTPVGQNAENILDMALFYLKIQKENIVSEIINGKKREALNHFGANENANIQQCFYKKD